MEITSSHLRRTHRYPVILKRGEAWTPEMINAARERLEMELLTNVPKLNEGRGRQASDSSVNFDGLLAVTGTDSVTDAARHLVSLGSPMILAVKGDDWKGTISGAQKIIKNEVAGMGYAPSFRKVEVDGKIDKSRFMFSFKTVELEIATDSDADSVDDADEADDEAVEVEA